MRASRLKFEDGTTGHYHCISRCVGGMFLLKDQEKERLCKLIWRVAEFCGLRIVTYCVMSNHFHVLVEVPAGNLEELPDKEVVRRIAALYGPKRAKATEEYLAQARKEGQQESAKDVRQLYLKRMGDVSIFMQEIKQRFSRWYNRRHERYGTVWADRFKSMLVEPTSQALLAVAGYIDLNPVRAGLVLDPKEYRWCGYGEAMGGDAGARRGLAIAVEAEKAPADRVGHWTHTGTVYRKLIMSARPPRMIESGDLSQKVRGEISQETAREVIEKGGRVPLAELLRLRVRYFNDGLLLGSREYVEKMFDRHRSRFGANRRSGARRMRGVADSGFWVLRDLRVKVFG